MRRIYSRLTGQPSAAADPAPDGEGPLSASDALVMIRAFEALNIGSFWSTDAEGQLNYLSENALAALTQGAPAEGQSFADLFVRNAQDAEGQRTLAFVLARKHRFDRMIVSSLAGEVRRMWSVSAEPRTDEAGAFIGFNGHIADVTSERQSAEESSALAMNDHLTGLVNRRHMTQLLERTVLAFNHQRRACATLLIDLDRFKQVNDTLGHPVGDELLKQVAHRLVKVIGDRDRVCRLGGDEFQVILPDMDDRGQLGEMAQAVITALSEPYSIEGNRCMIGASVGVAISPYDGTTGDELVRNADLALYAAKHSGRGRYRFYSGELLEAAEKRRQLEEDLHDALPGGQMDLVYQPVVDTKTHRITGAETLLRWLHPTRGSISPALFIPIAEESALICRIGEWTLRKACEDAASWPLPLRVAVNVSPVQFADASLPKLVANVLAVTGLDPARLELEITEGVFLQEGAATNAMFKALKSLGVRLVLDDFGTGYSSLGYLKTAPFDKIKIDQSFVRGATRKDTRNKAIISAIVTLAEALGMETTAEGVESFDQLELVKELKISHIQGYLFGKPESLASFIDKAANADWMVAPEGPAFHRMERTAMYRHVGVIHEDHYYPAMLRNLSASGALISGIVDVPNGTRFVIDFGEGQFVIGTVRRTREHHQGVQFDRELVSDGNGGLCTRNRILAHHLLAAGIPRSGDEFMTHQISQLAAGKISMPSFAVLNKNGTITTGPRMTPDKAA